MKTITLIHYAYPPHIGGVERLMSEQASVLTSLGYTVNVLTGSGESGTSGIPVTVVPHLQAVRRFAPELQERIVSGRLIDTDFTNLSTELEAVLEKALVKTDVIVVHNMLTLVHNMPFTAAFASYVQKHPEKKIVVWVHDQTFIDNGQVVWDKSGVKLHEDVKKLLLTPLPGAIYAVISETLKALLLQVMTMDVSQVEVIPNGVNIKTFLEIDPAMWNLAKTYRLMSAFPVILSPVNILERKNLHVAIDIIAALKSTYPDIRYVISGKASEHRNTQDYERQLKEQITRLGLDGHVVLAGNILTRALTDEEMHDLYQLSDVVLYTSRQENFGLPILEAGMSKTPIWVSDLPVFREIGGDALTYIPKDQLPQKTAEQLSTYLSHDPLVALRKTVKEKYALDRVIAGQLVPLIES